SVLGPLLGRKWIDPEVISRFGPEPNRERESESARPVGTRLERQGVVGPGLVATLGEGECEGRLAGLRVGGETDDIAIDDDGARMQHLASEELQRLGEDCPAIG